MTTYGSWQQPDDQEDTLLATVTQVPRDGLLSIDGSGSVLSRTSISTRSSSTGYLFAAQGPADTDIGTYTPALPANADFWDYESDHGELVSLRVIGAVSVQGIDTTAPGEQLSARGDLRRATSYALEVPPGFTSEWAFLAGGSTVEMSPGALAGYTLVDQWFGIDTSTPFEPFDFTVDVDDLDADRWLVLATATGRFVDALDESMAAFQTESMAVNSLVFQYVWRPPRIRPAYNVIPPLRQFPRADNLVGTGGVRQRSAGSRQASNRQGWPGTYLRAAPKPVDFMGESETSGPRVCNHSRAYRPPG